MFSSNFQRICYLGVSVTIKRNLNSQFKALQSVGLLHQISKTTGDHLQSSHYRSDILLLSCGFRFASTMSSATSFAKQSSSTESDLDNMSTKEEIKNAKSLYEFSVKDTHGNDVPLENYKGNVVLVVNIASQCGLTKNNYKKLTELKEKFGDKGLKILNFPCNQFASQMPEADGEAMVCHLRDAKADIGDVFQKVDVNGSNAAPVFQYLKAKQTGTLGSGIKWNFTKFLVDKDGKPVNRYAPTTDPMDIAKDIEKLLS